MITAASLQSAVQSAVRRLAMPLLLACSILLLGRMDDVVRNALAFDRALMEAGQWWRLLSAHLVHLSFYHTAVNLLGLMALLILCPQSVATWEWARRLVLLALFTSLALYILAPEVDRYVGFSGVLHGLFLLGLVPMVRRRDAVAIVCLLYLVGKLAGEVIMGASLSDEQAIGGRVVTQAHLFGTLAGFVYGAWFGTFRKGVTPQ